MAGLSDEEFLGGGATPAATGLSDEEFLGGGEPAPVRNRQNMTTNLPKENYSSQMVDQFGSGALQGLNYMGDLASDAGRALLFNTLPNNVNLIGDAVEYATGYGGIHMDPFVTDEMLPEAIQKDTRQAAVDEIVTPESEDDFGLRVARKVGEFAPETLATLLAMRFAPGAIGQMARNRMFGSAGQTARTAGAEAGLTATSAAGNVAGGDIAEDMGYDRVYGELVGTGIGGILPSVAAYGGTKLITRPLVRNVQRTSGGDVFDRGAMIADQFERFGMDVPPASVLSEGRTTTEALDQAASWAPVTASRGATERHNIISQGNQSLSDTLASARAAELADEAGNVRYSEVIGHDQGMPIRQEVDLPAGTQPQNAVPADRAGGSITRQDVGESARELVQTGLRNVGEDLDKLGAERMRMYGDQPIPTQQLEADIRELREASGDFDDMRFYDRQLERLDELRTPNPGSETQFNSIKKQLENLRKQYNAQAKNLEKHLSSKPLPEQFDAPQAYNQAVKKWETETPGLDVRENLSRNQINSLSNELNKISGITGSQFQEWAGTVGKKSSGFGVGKDAAKSTYKSAMDAERAAIGDEAADAIRAEQRELVGSKKSLTKLDDKDEAYKLANSLADESGRRVAVETLADTKKRALQGGGDTKQWNDYALRVIEGMAKNEKGVTDVRVLARNMKQAPDEFKRMLMEDLPVKDREKLEIGFEIGEFIDEMVDAKIIPAEKPEKFSFKNLVGVGGMGALGSVTGGATGAGAGVIPTAAVLEAISGLANGQYLRNLAAGRQVKMIERLRRRSPTLAARIFGTATSGTEEPEE